jgi:hypothetical protein
LAQQIVHQTAFVTYSLERDKRVVLPKKTIQALILHKRYGEAGMDQPTVNTRAALLHDRGREHA